MVGACLLCNQTKSDAHDENEPIHSLRDHQRAVNPRTGRLEVVFVDLASVYPNRESPMSEEYSFEELRAKHRGWLDHDWASIRRQERAEMEAVVGEKHAAKQPKPKSQPLAVLRDTEENPHPQTVPLKGSVDDDVANDENVPPSQAEMEKAKAARRARREERANRTRKIKVIDTKEVKGETQTIQTNLDSPVKPKIRRKKTGPEATMTLHTKEAMDEIYGIFNQPLKSADDNPSEIPSGDESTEEDDDDYTSAGESTGTGRLSGVNSEFGDDTTAGDFTLGTRVLDTELDDDGTDAGDTDTKSVVSAWSDFTESKHIPNQHQQKNSGRDSDAESEKSEDDSFDENENTHAGLQEQHDPDLATPTSPVASESLPTRFVPVPPEDYEHSMRPYRDPLQAANNRLPFMTPIVEKTESSLGFPTTHAQKDYFAAKTPSRTTGAPEIPEDADEPCSSPLSEILSHGIDGPGKVAKLALTEAKPLPRIDAQDPQRKPFGIKELPTRSKASNGPIIQDAQCNPVDETIRRTILTEIQPPLESYDGYFADHEQSCGKGAEIRKYTKSVSKTNKNASEKTTTHPGLCPTLAFTGTNRTYTVKRELGKGAFAPVYLVESQITHDDDSRNDDNENAPVRNDKGASNLARKPLEAIKMEDPPTPWEFYIMRQAKRRLGVSRAADSILQAHEMHVFADECYLVEEFRDQGTLLDLVNLARAENGVMDEQLAMFFTIELFRTVEALHGRGILHGDLKSDNILVRFEAVGKDGHWSAEYARDGGGGWSAKGIALIDFGRGIDMQAFQPDVQFIADWPTTEADCAEMRELRPWTYQIDYHGLAGIVHNLLFGKYISTVAERAAALGAGATKTYRIKESLKRYWQTDIWSACFDLLLNPVAHVGGEEGARMPVVKGMRGLRERMEAWLEANCEKGVGLKALVRRMEEAVKRR